MTPRDVPVTPAPSRRQVAAYIIVRLMIDLEHTRAERDALLVENEELRFELGESEYYQELAARWAEHLHPQNGQGRRPCQRR